MNEDFKYMAAIAEHGSISKAARAAHVSQPALSQRLKRIESQIGASLFDRSSIPLKATDYGEVYLKYALRAIAMEEAMRREVGSLARQGARKLGIGVSMPRANALLAKPIVSFYETHQGCTVHLREMNTLDQMHRLFLEDEIDFAVLTPLSPDPTLYDLEVLYREQLIVIASDTLQAPQFQRAHAGRIGLSSLEGVPFVLPTCGGYFDPLIDRLIELSHAQLDIVVRNCSAELALSLVGDGLGVSIVPSTWITGVSGLQTFELDGVPAGNVLRYVRRSDRLLTDEESLFMDILRRQLKMKSPAS